VSTTQELKTTAPPVEISSRALIILALLATYIIWGSTYLAIVVAIQSFPPYLMTAIRFVIAGTVMFFFMRSQGSPAPTRRQWRNSAVIGLLLMGGGMGGVAFAEQWVASGLAATMVAAVPLWVALFSGLWGRWPHGQEWIGLLIGFSGVVLLNIESGMAGQPLGTLVMFISPIFWALGSVWSRHLDLPNGLMLSATEMLTGGVWLLLISIALGERMTAAPTVPSILAVGYLTVFGSLIAFTAYGYLLGKVRPALATSYAYVNPVIAVALGIALVGEHITPLGLVAMPLVLVGVALIAFKRQPAEQK
jgi:drug/metabolite transporter (DMT)-like permease